MTSCAATASSLAGAEVANISRMRVRSLFLIPIVALLVACPQKGNAPAAGKTVVRTKVVPSDGSKAHINETLPVDISVLERSAMGSKVDPSGKVIDSKDTFQVGEPVYVTMWLKESPGGLQTSVRFLDAHDKEVAWPKTNMNGKKVITQRLDTSKLAPGTYHAVCYWGMNEERDYPFKIEGKKHR